MKRELLDLGMKRFLLLEEFLPEPVRDALHTFAEDSSSRFRLSDRTLNDPEYTKTQVMGDPAPFDSLFRVALEAGWRDLLLNLAIEIFDPEAFDIQLSRLLPGSYRKPRAEAEHGMPNSKLTFVYFTGCLPRPYDGATLTFFERNPYLPDSRPRRLLEVDATPNMMVIFSSRSYYELGEVVNRSGYPGICYILDGSVR